LSNTGNSGAQEATEWAPHQLSATVHDCGLHGEENTISQQITAFHALQYIKKYIIV